MSRSYYHSDRVQRIFLHHGGIPMPTLNLILDFILIGASVWMFVVLKQLTLGGVMGVTMNLVAIGAIVLGLAHILETFTFQTLHLDADMVEFIHRLNVLLGFLLLTEGFRRLVKELKVS